MEREPRPLPVIRHTPGSAEFSLTGEPGRRRIVPPPPSPQPEAGDSAPAPVAPPEPAPPPPRRPDDLRLSMPPIPASAAHHGPAEPPRAPQGQAAPAPAPPPPPTPSVPTPSVPAPRDSSSALGLLHALKGQVTELEQKIQRQHLDIESLQRQLEETRQSRAPQMADELIDMHMELHPPKPETLSFELDDLLRVVIKHQASDLHIKVNSPPIVRLHGDLVPIGDKPLTAEECHYLVLQAIPERKRANFLHIREVDHAHVSQGVRFRLNAFLERGHLSAAFRMVRANIPSFEQLGLPTVMTRFANLHNGLVLVTGPAGCGKSTTLASLVNWINVNRKVHVVTVEDPIEYYHHDEGSFITQREIGTDTSSFVEALRQALRQDPNVILVGEMRDVETMMTAVTAAETGHLVLSTLHTPNTVQAIDRILDAFSGDQQKQIRMLLSSSLRGVVSQKLLARADGQGRVPAVEVLVCTSTISSLILEGNTKEIYPFIQQGAHEGMQTFTDALRRLLERGQVTREEAMFHAEQLTELRLATRHVQSSGPPPGTVMNRL